MGDIKAEIDHDTCVAKENATCAILLLTVGSLRRWLFVLLNFAGIMHMPAAVVRVLVRMMRAIILGLHNRSPVMIALEARERPQAA